MPILMLPEEVRFRGEEYAVIKAGVLPYYQDRHGEYHVLIQRPLPQRDAELLPFQLARGSRQAITADGREVEIRDLATAHRILKEEGGHYLSAQATAAREGEEELGLRPQDWGAVSDCGPLAYHGYGIQFFAVQVEEQVQLVAPKDSLEVKWVTLSGARTMCQNGTFKQDYLPLLEAMIMLIL